MAWFAGQLRINFPSKILKYLAITLAWRLGKLQKNFELLLRKLIRNCPPNHAITSTNSFFMILIAAARVQIALSFDRYKRVIKCQFV